MESTPPFSGVLAVLVKISAHGADELTRAIGTRIERVGDLLGGLVADAKLFLVDKRVVDAVDHQLAQHRVLGALLEQIVGDPVLEAERFEEVLIDNVGAGRDDGVDHVVADEVDENLLQAGADQRAGKAENDAAFLIAKHALVDGSCPVEVTGAEGHVLHGVDESNDVVLLDIDVLNGVLEEFLFRRHNSYRISTFAVIPLCELCEF